MMWNYDNRHKQWKLASGDWRATAQRLGDHEWYGSIERQHPPHDRRESPNFAWAFDARAWCESEILRLLALEDAFNRDAQRDPDAYP
jgi:hypothetical protein